MFFLDSAVAGQPADLIFSASDLVIAAECEYRLLRQLDEKLGRRIRPEFEPDPMLQRAAVLGDVHEHRVLADFVATHGSWNPNIGSGVYEISPIASDTGMDRALLAAKHRESLDALKRGADVVFQASFFDGSFHGRSDFLVRTATGQYAIYDTKLARHAKVTALLQLAAYGDQLLRMGLEPDPTMTLVLGNGVHSDHVLRDVLPVFYQRRARFLSITGAHRKESAVEWGDARYTACGRCDYCAEQVELHRDLLLVAGMTGSRRAKLQHAGIHTIEQLAELPAGTDSTLNRLRDQARLQTGRAELDGEVSYPDGKGTESTLGYRILPENTLDRLPPPSPGDIFFDFEGDPLWQDPLTGSWGIEYLFGVLENPESAGAKPVFRPFWAHNRLQERQAFTDFLAYLKARRQRWPDLHVYHYASYEKTALRHLSLTHVVGEAAVDELLRDGVLVDLYETVRHSVRISAGSYSIKKLEPLYMGTNLRSGEVKDAGASVVAYANYCTARDEGRAEEAADILAAISDYNEYDCLSTLELHNWLLSRAAERGIGARIQQAGEPEEEQPGYEPTPEETALLAYLETLPQNVPANPDEQAVALLAAAVGYHRREDKQFWWAHYDRLNTPPADWVDLRDVFLVEQGQVLSDWAKPSPRSNPARTIRLSGHLAEGSNFTPGGSRNFFRMYADPLPDMLLTPENARNVRAGQFGGVEVVELDRDAELDLLVIRESLPRGAEPYGQLPLALTAGAPVRTTGQRDAIASLAAAVASRLPDMLDHPGIDLLRRRPPRLRTLTSLPPVGPGQDGYVEAITAAVADLDSSYLAVQGPPGTGKTHVGAHVLARLVERGWKIGVVAQSHAVVENMLSAAVVKAGVPADRTAKKQVDQSLPVPWHGTSEEDVQRLLASSGGALIGGTAWTMTGSSVPPGSLDLLVIDEAGQFSLANTLAVCRATRRLLLLGDPQQLPQVSQGRHPAPVDESALGWLSRGHHVLPEEFGYFLATTWRMHPELCAAVSAYAYDGKLRSAPAATLRRLEGPAAGLASSMVQHSGNSTSSPEEAEEVVRQVKLHLGCSWLDPSVDDGSGRGSGARPLELQDILVVAAYNAQVQLIRTALEIAGLGKVRVGTVDKFQGQEAAIVLVSLAASTPHDVPRGMDFLLSRNRINVAISRGQWRAVVVQSPALTDYLPAHPAGLEQLGAFLGLCSPVNPSPDRPRR
ncbi:MAG: nuclease [Micrococcaceae bacterium]|nr:nuclease [Micrococcaceae bacterium]